MMLENLEKRYNCDVIYLDFSKAYDKVDFSTLLMKLREIGINGKLGSWIGSFLTERKHVVRVGDILSRSEEIISEEPMSEELES